MSATTPMKRSEHAADEAGGEVVYSSDGLEPLPIVVKPPPVIVTAMSSQTQEFDSLNNDPAVSMEEAMQALFLRQIKSERPQERIQRLQRELENVAKDMAADDALQQQVAELQKQLVLQTQRVQAPRLLFVEAAADANSSSAAVPPDDLEQLMERLERAIGSMGAPDNRKGLLERLTLLEKAVEQIDMAHLERAAQQAKLLRQDLQAASKAKSKLSTSSGSQDDVKKITELYTAYTEISGLSAHLPILTQRLQTLSQQHVNATLWSQQLAACEQLLQRLQEEWKSTSEAVSVVEGQWKTVESQLAQHIQGLDERLNKVQQQL